VKAFEVVSCEISLRLSTLLERKSEILHYGRKVK